LLALLLIGEGAVCDQGNIDLAHGVNAVFKHRGMGTCVSSVHGVQSRRFGPSALKVGGGLLKFFKVSADQKKLTTFRGPAACACRSDR
jgi:hypothetical protein